nr:hypothetical protein [Tanacetum cinerariifolium]
GHHVNLQGRHGGETGGGPEEKGDFSRYQRHAGPGQDGGRHGHGNEYADQRGGQAAIRQLAADDVAGGQPQPDQHQGPGHAQRRNAGDLPQQRRDVGEQREHRSGEQGGHAQRQPDPGTFERTEFSPHVEFLFVALGRQETDQADEGNDADHGDREESRAPARLLPERGAQRDHAGEHQNVVIGRDGAEQVADDEDPHQRDQRRFAREFGGGHGHERCADGDAQGVAGHQPAGARDADAQRKGHGASPENRCLRAISSKLLSQLLQKRLNGVFVTFEEMPLAVFLAGDQANALQSGQVSGNGRLRQPRALVDLTGTHAVFKRVILIGETGIRVLEPDQNLTANRVSQGFYYFVEVDRHVVLNLRVALYRDGANFILVNRDIQI